MSALSPLYPQLRTLVGAARRSHSCHKETLRDIVPCCREARFLSAATNGAGTPKPTQRLSSIKRSAPQLADAFIDEGAHLVRHEPRLRIDHLHRHRIGLEFFQYVFELAGFPVGRDHVRQEHAEAQTVDAGIYGAVDSVAGHDAGDRDCHFPLADPKVPLATGDETDVSDAAMAADIIRHSRDAVAAQVLRACAHDAAYATHRDRHERRILEMGDPHSDIHTLLDKVHDAVD